jgi:hypothetical protein
MKKLAMAILIWLVIPAAQAAEKSNASQALQDTLKPDFKTVTVTGNTVVYFVQSRTEYVTVEEADQADISITQIGNNLQISSNRREPAIVTVYFKNIYRIIGSDRANIRSAGKVNLQNLQIMLTDDAAGRFKANTNSLYTLTDGQSKLELTGKTEHHIYVGNPNVNTKNLIASSTDQERQTEIAARWESDYGR